VAAWLLLLLDVEPVPTWFYVFAWYPTLALLDGVAARLDGRPSLLARRGLALSLLAWSPVVWLWFEAANFRLQNWYYVLLPAHPVERWAGIVLSFATVLPAIMLAERALAAAGVFRRALRPVIVRPWHLSASTGLGVAAAGLALAWPRLFFPLVWGVGLLLAEPLVYRRTPRLSLYRDLERGEWGRIGRLLVGGLGIGLLWELYNHVAAGSWIYTVPGLEAVKLFEMPPLGFVGFPVFALEAWAIYGALCALGVATPTSGEVRVSRRRTLVAGALATALSAATLLGMERYAISSTAPRLVDLPGLRAEERAALRDAGLESPRAVARASPEVLVARGALDSGRAREVFETARLVMLRGLGAEHARTLSALGIAGVCDVVEWDGDALARAVRGATGRVRPTPAEARVWLRAAQRACVRRGRVRSRRRCAATCPDGTAPRSARSGWRAPRRWPARCPPGADRGSR
jgi:hypothetical protein